MEVYLNVARMEIEEPPYDIVEDYVTSLPDDDIMYPSSLTDITVTTRRPGDGENLPCKQLLRFVINSVLVGLVCLFGFVGNSVSYVVIGRETDIFPVARFLLRALALADNTFLVLWFIQFSLKDLFVYTASWATGHRQGGDTVESSPIWLGVRLATYPMIFAIQGVAIWLTLLIAASRWAVVCHPAAAAKYFTLKVVRWYVAAITVVPFIYNIPRFFEVTIESLIPRGRRNTTTEPGIEPRAVYYLDITEFGRSRSYKLVYQQILYYIFSFFLPFLLLVAFNTRLIIAYKEFRRKREALLKRHYPAPTSTAPLTTTEGQEGNYHRPSDVPSPRHQASTPSENNITLIMIIIILIFIVCNAPGKIVQMLTAYREPPCLTATFFARELSIVLEVFSSCVNFLIYYVFLKRFCHHLGKNPCAGIRARARPVGATTSTLLQPQGNGQSRAKGIWAEDKKCEEIMMLETAKRLSEVVLAECKDGGYVTNSIKDKPEYV